MRHSSRRRTRGFSLLEMMVAIAILGLSLGALYQSVSGATRNLRTDEKYAYGVELARSLLANNARVPAAGVTARGETEGGFAWTLAASPLDPGNAQLARGALQNIEIAVSWQDGLKRRRVVLHSVVEGVSE
jgi:general secretion pathway protein I